MLRWGATDEEVRGAYPGAAPIPDGKRGATMAITIDAAPSRVWPWLVQMGCNRAGFCSWDRLDNGGVPSAREIHPEWQDTAIGDRLGSTPSGKAWFEVAALEPERFLGLRAPLGASGRPFETSGVRPRVYSDSLWGFQLKEVPGGRTRLGRQRLRGQPPAHPRDRRLPLLGASALDHADATANLKRRAEGATRAIGGALAPSGVAQGLMFLPGVLVSAARPAPTVGAS